MQPIVEIYYIENYNCGDDESLFSKKYNISYYPSNEIDSEARMHFKMVNGTLLCAKRGGANYKTAVRVEPHTL